MDIPFMNIAILKAMIISMPGNQIKNIIKDNEFLFFTSS